jgi:putative DNA primase/helicase
LIEHTKLRDFLPDLRQKYECSIHSESDALRFKIVAENYQISELEAEMLRLHSEDVPMTQIAHQLEISKSTVSRTLKKLQEVASNVKSPPAE